MFSSFFLLFCLFFRLSEADSAYKKMIVINGEPNDMTTGSALTLTQATDWDACLEFCYTSDTCVAVYSDTKYNCFWFAYYNIFGATKASADKKIAVAVVLTEQQCPSENPFASSFTSNYFAYAFHINANSVKVVSDGNAITISYGGSPCPLGSSGFLRRPNVVCLQAQYFDSSAASKTYDDAYQLCMAKGGVKLTGPANQAEVEFWQGLLSPDTSNYLWLDGKSQSAPRQWDFQDYTHNKADFYPWASGQPDSTAVGYCLYMGQENGKVDDVECGVPFDGAACLMQEKTI